MRLTEFHRLLGQIGRLSPRQRAVLCDRLALASAPVEQASGVVAVLNARVAERPACPRCGSSKVHRWGKVEGVQRLRCCACRRTFNPLSCTPLARLRRRDLWLDYAGALEEGLGIRAAGERLGVHYNTTFRWRHRWLEYLRDRKPTTLSGTVEADHTVFRECRRERGGWIRVAIGDDLSSSARNTVEEERPRRSLLRVPVLIVRDHNGATTDAVLPAFEEAAVGKVLGPLLDSRTVVLCTDRSAVYRAACRKSNIRHHRCTPGQQPGGENFHTTNVVGYRRGLAVWMRRFNGVSSHYLANYLGWRRLLDQSPESRTPAHWLRLALERNPPPTVT